MKKTCTSFLAFAFLLTAWPRNADAQILVEVGAGVTATSTMVKDSIFNSINVGTDPGFAVSFRLGTPLDSINTLQLGLTLSRNTMVRKVSGEPNPNITSVNVWFPSVGLQRKFVGPTSIRGMIGALIYNSEDTVGTPFRDGSPVLAAAGMGLTYRPGFTNGLSLDISWDLHQFNTPALRLEGFSGNQVVHRVTLLLQLGVKNAK
jgi:hypothetical protein